MLDIKFVRMNPDVVKENIKKKFQDEKLPLVDEVLELDKKNRDIKQEVEALRADRNKISKEIGACMAKGEKEEAEELLSMYNPNVKYIYQGTENDFVALKEKGLEGYVFLMDADTDLGMFVNKDDAKIYYFHPSGYHELAE